MEEVRQWRSRLLETISPMVYLDCLVVKEKREPARKPQSGLFGAGVTLSGNKERLRMWLSANEGAKFWLAVLTELQNRGVKAIFIACVDGLTGFVSRHGKCLSSRGGCSCAWCIWRVNALRYW